MAIAFVQSKTGSGANTASVSATFDAAPTLNNLLIARYHSKDHYPSTPTGWTKAAEVESWGVATLFYKVAGVAEGSTVTVTDSVGTSYQSLTISEFSGTAVALPLDKTATATSNGNTVTSQGTGTTATTAEADELLVALIGMEYGPDVTVDTASWTNSFTHETNVTTNQGNEEGHACARQIVAVAGTYSTVVSSINSRAEGIIATFKSDGGAPAGPSPGLRTLATTGAGL